MDLKLNIRPVQEQELTELAAMYTKAYQGMEEYSEPSADKAAQYLKWLHKSYSKGFIKAELNSAAVGFIAFNPHWHLKGQEKGVAVHELVVDPDWQGRGIGSVLMKQAIDTGRKLGRQKISLWVGEGNKKARRWYVKLGFVEEKRKGIWIHMILHLK